MTYIPISPHERDAMLETIGVKSLDDLFEAVPATHRFPNLNLPPALTEMEAMNEVVASRDGITMTITADALKFEGLDLDQLLGDANQQNDEQKLLAETLMIVAPAKRPPAIQGPQKS